MPDALTELRNLVAEKRTELAIIEIAALGVAEIEQLQLTLAGFEAGAQVEADAGDEARAEVKRLRAENAVVLPTLEEYATRCEQRDTAERGLIYRARGVRAAAQRVKLAMQEAAEAAAKEF